MSCFNCGRRFPPRRYWGNGMYYGDNDFNGYRFQVNDFDRDNYGYHRLNDFDRDDFGYRRPKGFDRDNFRYRFGGYDPDDNRYRY